MMNRLVVCACLLFALAVPSVSKEKKSNFPQLIVKARFVYVTTYYGSQINFRIPTDDRYAMADVEEAFKKWGQYIVVFRPEDADIIVLVRKGRLASTGASIHVGSRGPGTDQSGPSIGTVSEVGMPYDSLAIYNARTGTDTAPLWRRMAKDGLNPPGTPLVKEFRKAVEEAEKQQP